MTYSIGEKKRKIKTGPVPDSYMRPIRGEQLGMDIALAVVIDQMRLNKGRTMLYLNALKVTFRAS